MKRISRLCTAWFLGLSVTIGLLATSSSAAGQAPAKSSPEALRIYGDAVGYQNGRVFDLAAEEYGKFLAKFPDDPLAPNARHYLGVCQRQLKELEKAIAAFETVITKYPNFKLRQDAYLGLGSCQFNLGRADTKGMYAKAAATFSAMIKEFPTGKYADEAYYLWGESLYSLDQKKGAVAAYSKLAEDFPESKRRPDGLYALGTTREELGKYPDAGKAYDLFLEEFPDHKFATEVRMRKAETIMQAGEVAEAEKRFGEVAAVEGFAMADHAILRQAECASRQDKFAAAGDLYSKIPTDFPQSAYVKDAMTLAARCYYQAERFDQAAKWLDKVIATRGKDVPEAAHWRAQIHLKSKEPDKAAALAAKVLSTAQKSPYLVNLKMDQADALYEIPNRRADSLPLYLKVATDHADSELAPQALYSAAFTALELGEHKDALTHATAFSTKHPDHTLLLDVNYVAAESCVHLNNYADAEKRFRELVTGGGNRPELEQWQLRLGLVLYLQKKRKEVVQMLSPLAASFKSAGNKAHAQFLVGTSQYYLGDYKPAIAALKASLAADPKWAQADETWLNLSRAQRKLNQFEPAKTSVKRMLADFPESKLLDRAHFRLAEYSYASNDYKTAVSEYALVVTKWPKSILVPHALYGKGWAQLRQNDHAGAAQSLTALIDGHDGHRLLPAAHNARAVCRQQTGDFAGGVQDVDEYLKSNPAPDDRADALLVRGLCEAGLKKYADAAATFQSILSDKPDYSSADRVLYELAWALKSQDKDADALKHFTNLTTEHPESPYVAEALFHIGEDQYGKKEYTKAAASYAASKEKAPRGELGEKAAYKLGWSHYLGKAYEAALEAFSDQLSTYPSGKLTADGLFMKAECLFKLENYEEAYPAYIKAQGLPASSDAIKVLILLHGGQSAGQLEKWKESIELLAKIPDAHPDSAYVPEALYEQGWATQNLDQPDEALKLYEAAAAKSRGAVGARARFMMGEIYFDKKNFTEAIRQFQRVIFGFGGDRAAKPVKKWQAKSAYEAGRCSEVQINEARKAEQRKKKIADAKKYYSIVVEKFPDASETPAAKKRLTALEKL